MYKRTEISAKRRGDGSTTGYTRRTIPRATAIRAVLQKASSGGHSYDVVALDLSSLGSVRRAAADISRRVTDGSTPPIRALVLNVAFQEFTTHFHGRGRLRHNVHSNYVSHFLLAPLLLPRSIDKERGRILILGRWSHKLGGPLPLPSYTSSASLDGPMDPERLARGRWSSAEEHHGDPDAGYRRCGTSKLSEVMMMRELSRRTAQDATLSSVVVLGLDPASMASNLGMRANLAHEGDP
ncbi:hypothetical protein DL764_003413 [Monosporascus ibericus]|uniref:Ketoreductase (KR) domain-containing protein n=1 Tax=Monosporascus ibericus TaxID=155417 RepID=A0A4Q4TKE6_9PEZI|nr:hypothetical protein DL764_003413 [Monosporascus ibericus]